MDIINIKTVWAIMGITLSLTAADTTMTLQEHCLACHTKQQIPSSLIYRRYLMKYSTPERIEKAMLDYLRAPERSRSIMPPQFFLKFPMKPPMEMDDATLRKEVKAYIETFDIRKKLVLDGEDL